MKNYSETSKLFISTSSFSQSDVNIIQKLKDSGVDYELNPYGRKMSKAEILQHAEDCDTLIAGTEDLRLLVKNNEKLKMISRVGVGLDGVPLSLCKKLGIGVSYTPNPVIKPVAELTLGLMLSAIRNLTYTDKAIRMQEWVRPVGESISDLNVGIVGLGRIASYLLHLLIPFNPKSILISDNHDKNDDIQKYISKGMSIRQVSMNELLANSDVITIHVPLTSTTENLIAYEQFKHMRDNSILINTSRGGIVNEKDLFTALETNIISGAALDVYEKEPYDGPLANLDNIILSTHLGSNTSGCRNLMEQQALDDILHFYRGEELEHEVPEYEFKASRT